MAVSPEIVEALRRLNPACVVQGDHYVDRELGAAYRTWDLPERLEALIRAGFKVRAVLFGAVGVGKSSELARWAERLSPYALVARITLGPHHLVQTNLRTALLEDGAEDWMSQLSPAQRSSVHASAAGIGQEDELPPDNGLVLTQALRAVVRRPLVLLVDGLDLEDDEVVSRFLPVLAQYLGQDVDALVVVGDERRFAIAARDELPRGFDYFWHLPAFPVVRPDGQPDGAVIEHLGAGLARRLRGLDVLDDPRLFLAEAAKWSGGIPRDAIRILHCALLAAAQVGKVNAFHLTMGLREVRQDLAQSLRAADWQTLREVARTGNHLGARALIAGNAIIAYETPEERYWRPHPLLEAMLEQRKAGTGGAAA